MNRADRKRATLRAALKEPRAVVAVGAHDALSAKLIGSYGFDAVWVSGFGVATMAHALPDLNLTTMTEALAAAVRIDGATELPVIADVDNGFGGLGNVVRTLVEYERAGISAISVEDNLFPKRNSLYTGESKRELIPRDEQSRRIRAAKRFQDGDGFMLIARVESLIAGHGVEDACARADAYVEAGADAILIHSRDKTLAEIEGFLGSWKGMGSVPLVAVPTLFPTFTSAGALRQGLQPGDPRQPPDARLGEGDGGHPGRARPGRSGGRRRPDDRDASITSSTWSARKRRSPSRTRSGARPCRWPDDRRPRRPTRRSSPPSTASPASRRRGSSPPAACR